LKRFKKEFSESLIEDSSSPGQQKSLFINNVFRPKYSTQLNALFFRELDLRAYENWLARFIFMNRGNVKTIN
jgi:hypothetical protein